VVEADNQTVFTFSLREVLLFITIYAALNGWLIYRFGVFLPVFGFPMLFLSTAPAFTIRYRRLSVTGVPLIGLQSFIAGYIAHLLFLVRIALGDFDPFRSPMPGERLLGLAIAGALLASVILSIIGSIIALSEISQRRWTWFCATPILLYAVTFGLAQLAMN
jgi:hypothetical protein